MPPATRWLLLAGLAAGLGASSAAALPADAPEAPLFSTEVDARRPLPDSAVIGYDNTLHLQVNVTGPGGLVPPDEVHLSGEDQRGTSLSFSPNPVQLEPGRRTYPVNATYRPAATGPANLTVRAEGPARATDRWRADLDAVRDPVELTVTDVDDARSDWTVPLRVDANTTRLPRETVDLTVAVRWAGDDPSVPWNGTTQSVELTPSPASRALAFEARYGAGRYQVQIHAQGPRSRGASTPVLVDVEQPDESTDGAAVDAQVPDRPTRLALADDSVNADGKPKYPGQDVITRIVARDPNGVPADAAAVDVHRLPPEGSPVLVQNTTLPLPDDAWARRSVELEHRFGHAPLKDGRYAVTAELPGTEADPVRRTFRIRDEQAGLPDGRVPDGTAATPVPPLQGWALVADDNLGGGPQGPPVAELGILHARLYRYTEQLPADEVAAFPNGTTTLDLRNASTDGERYEYSILGDAGRFRIPLEVQLPDGPDSGRYHVTLAHEVDGTTRDLGSIYLDLEAPPAVTGLEATSAPPGANLTLDGTLDGAEGVDHVGLTLEAVGANGTEETLSAADASRFPARLPLPRGLDPGAELRVAATPVLPDGRRGTSAEATVAVEARPPAVHVAPTVDGTPAPRSPLRLVPRTVHDVNLTVATDSVHGADPDVTARLVDWNGATTKRASCTPADAPASATHCRLPVPGNLTAGRYTIHVAADGPGGTTTWNRSLEAGPWLDLAVDGPLDLRPDGDGNLAGSVSVENRGNVPAETLRIRLPSLQGPDGSTWEPDPIRARIPGTAADAKPGNPALLEHPGGPVLEPGARTPVDLEIPTEPGVPPGSYGGQLSVATTLEAPE
jgi:hypothetical protein